MKKLEVGDYVKNLTEKQFKTLLDIENDSLYRLTHGIPGNENYYENGLLASSTMTLNHARITRCTNELTYRQFLSRAKNTFKL
jgi:hypothetical protein